jgi:hypothetical protein
MLRVPFRGVVAVLAVANHDTNPLPVLLEGLQVSQPGALLEAVQLHPVPAVTVMVPLTAAALG